MIRTDDEASDDGPGAPPVVWQPPPAGAQSTRVGQFLRWLERERGLSFDGYDDLWRWSVDALEDVRTQRSRSPYAALPGRSRPLPAITSGLRPNRNAR